MRVIGVSGRGDRRLLDSVLPDDSELARVASGELDQARVEGDPLGGVVADRRQRPAMVLLLPISAETAPSGRPRSGSQAAASRRAGA